MNKEQYLAIVTAWKSFINTGKHKKYKDYYDYTAFGKPSMEGEKLVPWTTYKDYGYKWTTDLNGIHHLIYTLIRKRDVYKRFSEESVQQIISEYNWKKKYNYEKQKYISKILEPFGENLTIEIIDELISEFSRKK